MKTCSVLILLFYLFSGQNAHGQVVSNATMNEAVISHQFTDLEYAEPKKRKFIDLSNSSFFQKVNPLTYVSASLLFFYQRVLSEQIAADCSYQTSCSETTKKAIEKYGLIKGALVGVNQLGSCVPGNHHEHPEHRISKSGKIINDL